MWRERRRHGGGTSCASFYLGLCVAERFEHRIHFNQLFFKAIKFCTFRNIDELLDERFCSLSAAQRESNVIGRAHQ